MGNIKNRTKRNKRKAPNWRGIIRMRKPKNKNSKTVPSKEEFRNQWMREHNYCSRLDVTNSQTQANANQISNNSTVVSLVDENVDNQDIVHQTFDFDEWIEFDEDYDGAQATNKVENDSGIMNDHDGQVDLNTDPVGLEQNARTLSSDELDTWLELNNCYNSEEEYGTGSGSQNIVNNSIGGNDCSNSVGNDETAGYSAEYPTSDDGSHTPSGSDFRNIENNSLGRNGGSDSDEDNETAEHLAGQAATDENTDGITFKVTGRRIVDINLLFNEIKYLNSHSDKCNYNDMEVIKETKMGLRAIFTFRCRLCGIQQKITTCERNMEGMNVNKAVVSGITSVGCGFYNLDEFCAHADIPCMSDKTFQKNNKELQKDWWELAIHHSHNALMEEIRLAKAAGDVDSNGNALIIVITDGSWGKRSYGKGYSSLSGCAVLIGYRTQKIIYIGVKNKYCQTCANSYAINCPPNDHQCNINYEGASSGMETAIVLEGFKHCATLGARFPILIADGDASIYKELREMRLYKDPVIIIQKYECVNHLFKNFRKKFKALFYDTKYTPRNRKYMTVSKGNEICTGIQMAAKHWREANVSQSEKFNKLEKDCMNAPLHYFGQHDGCSRYFCEKSTTPESLDLIESLKTDKIFQAVLSLCQDYFASNVKSLIANYSTNVAENFNGVVAKFLGGKRINYSLAGSYKGRIGMAVVQYNTEFHGGSELHKVKFESLSGSVSCDKLENRRKRKLQANKIALQKKPRRKATYDTEASQVGYGEGCQIADKTGRAFELAVESEIAKLEENRRDRETILLVTADRENCPKWHEVRQNIINSFYIPRIINANNPKSYTNLTFEMLYNSKEFAKTAERKHYKLYEENALKAFSSLHTDHDLETCGIFIDKDACYLGATPLRLYGTESIVTVRCPLKAYNKSIDEAIDSKAINFWKRKRGSAELCVNKKSAWYLQIQGELHIADRKLAYLVVWLGENKIKIERVERDCELWNSLLQPKLKFFFNESMLKELADSRRDRKMGLRQFDPQQNTFL